MAVSHVGLIIGFVAAFAVIGLVVTLGPDQRTPKAFIDYDEVVDNCAGAWLITQRQLEGKSKYVDYRGDTADWHCYDYYTPIKRLGTGVGDQPQFGTCWHEKCCWKEPPSYGVKHASVPTQVFRNITERFRYSPAVAAKKGLDLPEEKLHEQIRTICGVAI